MMSDVFGSRLAKRDRRALQFAAVGVAVYLLMQYFALPAWDSLRAVRSELPLKEQSLAKYRRVVDLAGAQARDSQTLSEQLRQAEGGLLQAPTASLASAELEKWLSDTAKAQEIEVRSSDFQKVVPDSDGYTQIPVGLQFQCRIEQLVNFLSAIQSSERVLSISRLIVQPAGGNQKQLSVAMTVGGWAKSLETERK